MDGTDPAVSGSAVPLRGSSSERSCSAANFSSAQGLTLRAVAIRTSQLFPSAGEYAHTIGVNTLILPAPVVLPSSDLIPQSLRIQMYSVDAPAVTTVYKSTNGANPLNADGTPAPGASIDSAPFAPLTTESECTILAAMGNSKEIAFRFSNDFEIVMHF